MLTVGVLISVIIIMCTGNANLHYALFSQLTCLLLITPRMGPSTVVCVLKYNKLYTCTCTCT